MVLRIWRGFQQCYGKMFTRVHLEVGAAYSSIRTNAVTQYAMTLVSVRT